MKKNRNLSILSYGMRFMLSYRDGIFANRLWDFLSYLVLGINRNKPGCVAQMVSDRLLCVSAFFLLSFTSYRLRFDILSRENVITWKAHRAARSINSQMTKISWIELKSNRSIHVSIRWKSIVLNWKLPENRSMNVPIDLCVFKNKAWSGLECFSPNSFIW